MANKKKSTSSNKYQKKAVKTATKMAKKNPKAFFIILLVLVLVVGIGLAVYFLFLKDKIGPQGGSSSSEPTTSQVISSSDDHSSHAHAEYNPKLETPSGMSINFLELGSWYTGDSTFIKAGDVDILIDAGSEQSSAGAIKTFVDQYCEDGKLEYVIATHAHKDHIAGFVGTTTVPGIFDAYKIDTLIDFSQTDQDTTTKSGDDTLYGKYLKKIASNIESGNMGKHYTALQCVEETDGAKKQYTINDGVTMTILDQKFYHKENKASTENNYSVCTLFTHGSNNYLFTGDLESVGETSLVDLNNLPHCQLYKAGHHGSNTSSKDKLLDKITPEVVCICCCAGSTEYTKTANNQFPYQETINRLAKHTERIYVTTLAVDNDKRTYASMNGNICFKSENGKDYTVAGSNNSVILKDTEWFKSNRTWPTV